MDNIIIKSTLWLKSHSFIKAIEQTLIVLMPIALIGSYFQLLQDLLFTPDSLLYNIFHLDGILPERLWYGGAFVCRGMVSITFGVFGVYVSYFMARYTARFYQKDSTMAGMAAVLVSLFCTYANSLGRRVAQDSWLSSPLQVNGLFLSLLIGYAVGQIFHWLGKKYLSRPIASMAELRGRAWVLLPPLLVSLTVGLFLGVAIYELQLKLLNSESFNELVISSQRTNNLLEVLFLALIVLLLSWLGISYPLVALSTSVNNDLTSANLDYALRHGNSWNVPYKFLGSSLINCYGTMGTVSIVLAVIVLVLIRRKNREVEQLARINLLPAVFGVSWGFGLGLPLVLNPLFLPAMLLVPLINIALAGCAIAVKLIPVCVYPVLKGTPGILLAFLATNGDGRALIFSILLFLLDLVLLLPVVRLSEQVEARLNGKEKVHAQKS